MLLDNVEERLAAFFFKPIIVERFEEERVLFRLDDLEMFDDFVF
jgi:hypothetical protein